MTRISRAIVALALASTAACTTVHWYPLYEDRVVEPDDTNATEPDRVARADSAGDLELHATRTRIASLPLRIVLFPVNMLASGVSNFVMGGAVAWKMGVCIFIPVGSFVGLFIGGPCDAWHGYMFWEPTVADPLTWKRGSDG